jgi:membrane protein CcdC involved in cytochrome C biogenesis
MNRIFMDWTINATTFSSESFKGGQMSAEFFFLIAIILVLLQLRTRRVRLWAIWVPLVVLLPITAGAIYTDYGGPGTLLLSVAGFAVGCAIGVVIGTRMNVSTDDRGRIVLKGSLVAVTIWILVLGLKIFGKGIVGDTGIVSLDDLSAMVLAMTLGMIMARRAYVTLKYLQLKKQGTTISKNTVEPQKPA